MRNTILKMVSKGVISSDNANRLVNMKQNLDPIWKGIIRGYIDEKKLARFFEEEGYPVIYDEGTTSFKKDDIFKFFTPDVISQYLVFPISYKKENRDIILGFINAAHLDTVRQMIQHIFPDITTTYFHVPYSLFRRMVYKNFMFDMSKYASMVAGMETAGKISTEVQSNKGELIQQLSALSERLIFFTIENGSAVFRDESIINRFPLASLPTIRDGLQKKYLELSAESAIKQLSPTEKILLFTNMGVKRDDRIVVVSGGEKSESFFILINPRGAKNEIERLLSPDSAPKPAPNPNANTELVPDDLLKM